MPTFVNGCGGLRERAPTLRVKEGQVHVSAGPDGPGDDRRPAAHLGRGVRVLPRERRERVRRRSPLQEREADPGPLGGEFRRGLRAAEARVRHPEGDRHVRPARREQDSRQEPLGRGDLPEGRPRLRRRRGAGGLLGRQRRSSGRGAGEATRHPDRDEEGAGSTLTARQRRPSHFSNSYKTTPPPLSVLSSTMRPVRRVWCSRHCYGTLEARRGFVRPEIDEALSGRGETESLPRDDGKRQRGKVALTETVASRLVWGCSH